MLIHTGIRMSPSRVFLSDGLLCPICDHPMALRAVVMPPATIRVLRGLDGAAARAPPDTPGKRANA